MKRQMQLLKQLSFLSIVVLILGSMPVLANDDVCSQGESWVAIPQNKVVQSVFIKDVWQSGAFSENLELQLSQVQSTDRIPAKRMALLFVPVSASQISLLQPHQMDGVGGTVLQKHIFPDGHETPIVNVRLDQPGFYNVYSAGYDCDFAREQKKGLIRWRLFTEDNGLPRRISVLAPGGGPDYLASFNMSASGEYLIMYSFPSNRIVLKNPVIYQDKAIVKELSFETQEVNLSDYLERLGSEDLFYAVRGRKYWFGIAPNTAKSTITSEAQFEPTKVTAVHKTKSNKQSFPLTNFWSQEFAARTNRILEKHGYEAISEKMLLMTGLLGAAWLDRGIAFETELEKFITDMNPGAIALDKIVEILSTCQKDDLAIEMNLYFPEQVVGSSFEDGFVRLNTEKDIFMGGTATIGVLGERFYLKINGPVEIHSIRRNALTGKKELYQLNDCFSRDCNVSFGEAPIDLNTIILSQDDVASIRDYGLWLRSNIGNPELPLSPDQEMATYRMEFGKFSGENTYPISSLSGYLDSRDLVAKPAFIRHHANNPLSKEPEVRFELAGYTNLSGSVLPVGNSQLLKIARTGLGANGPPSASLSDVDVFGDFAPTQDATITPKIHAATQPWAFHFYPQKTTAQSEFLEGNPYSAVVELGDGLEAAAIVPFVYYPADYLTTFMVGSALDAETQKHNQEIAKSFSDIYADKFHLHADWIDLSSWRLGQVYGQTKGVSVIQAAQAELSSYLQGYPLSVSNDPSAIKTVLPYGKIYSIGQSDNTKTKGKFSDINGSPAGKLIFPESFSDPNWRAVAGIQEFSPELAFGLTLPQYQKDPQFVCLTKLNSPGLTCLEPNFVAKIRGTLGDPEVLKLADELFNTVVVPGGDDQYGWNKLSWHISGGRYFDAFCDLVPIASSRIKKAPKLLNLGVKVVETSAKVRKRTKQLAAVEKVIPAIEKSYLTKQSGYVGEKIVNVTEGNHQVPGEILRELRAVRKSGNNVAQIDKILAEFGGKRGNPNVRPVLKSFHQWWLHGDGKKLKNAGDGGVWNKWWKGRIGDGEFEQISFEEFALIHAESIIELEKQWVQFQRHLAK